jgi:hypothetical protein
MIWTWMTRTVRFTMRLYVGGVETLVPARWYFCSPNAPYYPFPHGCESRHWLANGEWNAEWGDTNGPEYSISGLNPGYQAHCYVGDPQWFVDGRLPADVLSRPDPLPPCCRVPAASGSGGLVLGGSGDAGVHQYASGAGGLTLGGSAAACRSLPVSWWLPIVLGGPPEVLDCQPAAGAGGLLVGGAASAHTASGSTGSGGGGETGCDACPDGASAEYAVDLPALGPGSCGDCTPASGTLTLGYGGGCLWVGPLTSLCGSSYIPTLSIVAGVVTLTLADGAASYIGDVGGWDCFGPLVLTLHSDDGRCTGWPVSVTVRAV